MRRKSNVRVDGAVEPELRVGMDAVSIRREQIAFDEVDLNHGVRRRHRQRDVDLVVQHRMRTALPPQDDLGFPTVGRQGDLPRIVSLARHLDSLAVIHIAIQDNAPVLVQRQLNGVPSMTVKLNDAGCRKRLARV